MPLSQEYELSQQMPLSQEYELSQPSVNGITDYEFGEDYEEVKSLNIEKKKYFSSEINSTPIPIPYDANYISEYEL
jgi:hypothetical protein